jgi:putative Mn2+ efflux pump MntP
MLASMSFPEILLIAVSIALDATIVAVGAGALARLRVRTALKVAFVFGAFQVIMPLLGYLLGFSFSAYVYDYGHIIGFALLFIVGGKMAYEAFQEEDKEKEKDITSNGTLFALAVATSIDALVVGVTFTFVPVNLVLALATIGIVTFFLALLGVYVGRKGKHLLGNRIELLGALILIALAFKILFQL